ncbi:MAG: nucleotidyl transferase AbiEii/AbiGii toxin family protein [Candidatus Binatia bacterium]
MDFDRLLQLLRALAEERVDYVLVGATALNFHGIVRATEDVDLFVRPVSENVEKLKKALRRVWQDTEIEEIRAEDLAGAYPTVRYGPPGEDFVIDVMSRLGTAIGYDDLEAETLTIEGVDVLCATPATLYRMKKDTIRPIDRADAAALRDKFGIEDD